MNNLGSALSSTDENAIAQLREMTSKILVIAMTACVKESGLDCPHKVSIEDAARIFNGVGPTALPEKYRKKLTKCSKYISPAVFVHDMDFAHGDGTKEDFHRANRRLAKNGRRCADSHFRWYNPMRYFVRLQAYTYAKICDAFGWDSYLKAIEETKSLTNAE